MKQLIFFLLANLFLRSISYSQCQKTQRIVAGTGITYQYGVRFLSSDTVVMVGDAGVVKSYDQGLKWSTITLPTIPSKNLRSVCFVDNKVGFTAGNKGVVMKTSNAGESWIAVNAPTSRLFRAVHFVDKDTGYVAGDQSTVFRTVDGGATWDSVATAPNGHTYTAVYFKSYNEGFLGGSSGAFYYTKDAGQSWQNYTSADTMITGFSFPHQDTGYACSNYGVIYKTTDGGESWVWQNSNNNHGFWGIAFGTTSVGYAGGGYGYLYRTEDGGKTWYNALFDQGTGQEVRSVAMWGDSLAMTSNAGSERIIIKNSDIEMKPEITAINDTLISTEATNYEWYINSEKKIHNFRTHAIDTTGYVQVVIQSKGCYAISDRYNISTPVFIEPTMQEKNEVIYPNPAYDKIYINDDYKISEVKIFDISGNTVIHLSHASIKEIDVDILSTGVYFVMSKTENGWFSQKIVVR